MTDAPSPPDGSASSAQPSERFLLRVPPTFGPRFFVSLAVAVGLVVVLFAQPLIESGQETYLLALVMLSACIPSLAALLRRRPAPASIEVLEDRLVLPIGEHERVAVRLRSIRALLLHRGRVSGFLFIGTDEREVTFPLRLFPGDEAERLLRAIRSRMSVSDDGERRLAGIDRLARVADRAYARTPVVTWAVVGTLTAIHVFLVATHRLVGVLDVASLGAVSPELVEAAGPYLAFTSHWVHGWRFQPLLVLPGLFVLGTLVERLLGHGVTALSILGSAALGGLVAAYYPGSPLHAGALIPAAGLLGTLAFSAQRYRGRMPVGFRLDGQWWGWLFMLAALAVMIHGVSVPGALFGLLTGVLVAGAVLDREPELPLEFSPRWAGLASLGLLALHIGSGIWAIEGLSGRGLSLERVAIEQMDNGPRLNEYAWVLAIGEAEPSAERLELALLAARRAAGLETRPVYRATYQDTKATVLHRMGRHDEAVALEREILDEFPESPTFATQLARFMAAAPEPSSPAFRPPAGLEIEIERRPEETSVDSDTRKPESVQARVRLAAPPERPQVLYAPVRAEGELAGLLRLPIPAGMTSTVTTVVIVPLPNVLERTRPEGLLKVEPKYVVEGRASGKLWPILEKVAEYP